MTSSSPFLALHGQPLHPIVVASHPRSGTHLTLDLLRRQFAECASWKYPGERLDRVYLPLEGLTTSTKGLAQQAAHRILQKCSHPIINTKS